MIDAVDWIMGFIATCAIWFMIGAGLRGFWKGITGQLDD